MERQEYTEKTYCFYELLKDYKIEIPIQNLPDGWYIRIWWD